MAYALHHAIETNPDFELVTTAADIRRLKCEGKTGAILSFEGFEPLGAQLNFLDLYYKLGLRIASLTHVRRNLYADGCYAADHIGGLTTLGKQAVARMNDLGIIIDLVHIGWPGFWEVLNLTTAPVILSHSTSTQFAREDDPEPGLLGKAPRPRLVPQRDRPMLEALAKNGGVLGIIWFYQKDLDDVLIDIETALDIMGEDHIGLGSDLFGLQLAPARSGRHLESPGHHPQTGRARPFRRDDPQIPRRQLSARLRAGLERLIYIAIDHGLLTTSHNDDCLSPLSTQWRGEADLLLVGRSEVSFVRNPNTSASER